MKRQCNPDLDNLDNLDNRLEYGTIKHHASKALSMEIIAGSELSFSDKLKTDWIFFKDGDMTAQSFQNNYECFQNLEEGSPLALFAKYMIGESLYQGSEWGEQFELWLNYEIPDCPDMT